MSVLLVEDDPSIALVITAALEAEGFHVDCCDSIAERDQLLAQKPYSALVTDVMLTDGDGIETIGAVRDAAPHMPIIILSAQNTLDTAVRASDTGAFEYFPKPFDIDELARTVRQAVGNAEAQQSEDGESPVAGLPLVGRSASMQAVYRMITRVLRNDLTVLILGESGTGKELVAEAIHQLGHRKSGPFVPVNTAAIPADLIESELFGHEKGAFMLDEIGEMSPEIQTKFLRVLETRTIERIGSHKPIPVDVRIVSATNRDLEEAVQDGLFRSDLYFRLKVIQLQVPPLRDRREDISVLALHFLKRFSRETGRRLEGFSERLWRRCRIMPGQATSAN